MCYGCYKQMGEPTDLHAQWEEALTLVKGVYEHSSVGGNLHVQLDDDNLADEFFDKFEVYDEDATPEQLEAECKCFDLLKTFTERERQVIVGLNDGYLVVENGAVVSLADREDA